MESRNCTRVFRPKIIVLSLLLFLSLLISCANPIKEPFNNLIGYWISEDGQRHFYFSKGRRLVITDGNKEVLFDVEYNIGVVRRKTGNEIQKKIWLNFRDEIFGEEECWFTFSEDKKRINSDVLGVLTLVDRRQRL
jgi:hypothetical protein